jgi:ribosomal protein S18 acetylase RimI-like enzyme
LFFINKQAYGHRSSKLQIRCINELDVPLMTQHRLDYLTGLQGDRDEAYRARLKTELIAYFRKNLKEGRFVALVAELDGKAVAYGGLVVKEIPGDFIQASYLEGDILNMYTIRSSGERNFVRILNQLLELAAQMGISKVSLHTSPDGEKLYRKYGFSEPVYPYLERPIEKRTK